MSVSIVEVSPRDGLQNETVPVPTADKVALIDTLVAGGLRRIECTSFVNPRRVPQLADAEEVAARLPRGTVSWIGLVLNERGLDRAVAAGMDEVNVVVVATDTFSRRNQGVDTAGGVAAWQRIAEQARTAGLRTTITIAAAFGCPFSGAVSVDRVRGVTADCLAAARPDELAFADTIGVGVPAQVRALAGVAAAEASGVALRWHFHNTRNTGYANAITAADLAGDHPVALDSSAGGIGGCPFAPDATGNIATEDLVYLLDRSGYDTGVDVRPLLPLAARLGGLLGHEVPGQLARAGVFPPEA